MSLNIVPGDLGAHNYGINPAAPDLTSPPALAKSAGPGKWDDVKAWTPDSPIFWGVAIVAATIGLIGFASSARVGPVRAAVAVGKS